MRKTNAVGSFTILPTSKKRETNRSLNHRFVVVFNQNDNEIMILQEKGVGIEGVKRNKWEYSWYMELQFIHRNRLL